MSDERKKPCNYCSDKPKNRCGKKSPDESSCTRGKEHGGYHVACTDDRHIADVW